MHRAKKKNCFFITLIMSTQNKNFLSPFLAPLIWLIIGIYQQMYFDLSLCIGITMSAVASIAIFIFFVFSYQRALSWSICFLFFSAGALTLQLQSFEFFEARSHLIGKKLTLHGIIKDKENLLKNKQSLTLDVDYITHTTTNESLDLSCSIQLYTNYSTNLFVGDEVIIENVAIPKKPPEFRSPSFNDYLTKENIHASVFLHTKKQMRLISRPQYSCNRWLWNMRENCYQGIKKKLSPETCAFLGLLFFGKKKYEQTDTLRDLFNRWGLAHYLARSGLHIVLLIGIWSFLLSLIPLNLWIKRLLLVLIGGIYAFLSWASIPFIRALSIFVLSSAGKLLWCQINIFHLLCFVCLGMLLLNPMNLFFIDFQLTFGLTFALLLSTY